MTELQQAALDVARRAVNMSKLIPSIEHDLLIDQADAIAAPRESALDRRERPPRTDTDHTNPGDWATATDTEAPVDLGHSDPTPNLIGRLGWFRKQRLDMLHAIAGVDRALDRLEEVGARALSVKPGQAQTIPTDDLCPGWTIELRTRLGGCGKVKESYRRDDGTQGSLPLCTGCRKAKYRASKDAEQGDEPHDVPVAG